MLFSNIFWPVLPWLGFSPGPIANGAPLRILPLGDSITFGYNEPSGNSYRRDLQCLLSTTGNPVSLIGSIQNGNWDNNESDAFNLHTLDEILTAAVPELTLPRDRKPNIILLHAGTVNLVLGVNVTTAPERLANLVDFVTTHNPDALVVVARVIPNANDTVNALIDEYNAHIPNVVSAAAAAASSHGHGHGGKGKRKVVLAPLMRGVTVERLPDGTHPDEKGYSIMARHWYEAIVRAGREGLVDPAEGEFVDRGKSAVPASGRCEDLVD
ncbi:SGNH hydrolase-type esterase domain-containing protein [Dichotomopilus funicola]|uniref:SGNH hydrolase-type esterase domain-containing protein n=1 Tax=Dichotomopilus funicola TaxID=1934379 RepID=A0AAN6UWB1_9PEZI|nr:SGNH hydrolase-type esterase domain-containing protein [Dichotomopilus funicola]